MAERKTGRPAADPEAVFQSWAALPEESRTYSAVATGFAISPRTVERYARDGRWRERTDARDGVEPVIRFKNPLAGEVVVEDLVHGRGADVFLEVLPPLDVAGEDVGAGCAGDGGHGLLLRARRFV